MFKRRTKLPQSQEAFDVFADSFLERHGFPVSDEFRAFFGVHVQGLPEGDDHINEKALAKAMRRSRVNEFAFYLINPKRRPQPEEKVVSDAPPEEHPTRVV